MGFASDTGYTPTTIADLMDTIRTNINVQFGTAYTTETFVGTNWYKYFYALIQKLQENEVKTSQVFLKLQDYFAVTNERIARPVVTNPGLIEKLAAKGYTASVKAPILADAGKLYVCVDTDELAVTYPATKLDINTTIKDSSVAGVVSQGTESSTIVLSNGQSFAFKFKLPNRMIPLLRLTTTLSTNNQYVVGSPDDTKVKLMNNIKARYRLGRNFEPQKYFTTADAPWTQSVLLEYSLNGGTTWSNAVYVANYDDLFVVKLENITIVEA